MTDLLPGTARVLQARVARAQRQGRVPSVVAGIVRDGGLAWSDGRGEIPGEAADDVQYRLGSITKTVTAVAVLRLREEGLLDLDEPLEQHLPGTPLGSRTIAQLLTHLGGVTSESPGPWWERTPGTTLDGLGLGPQDAVLPAGRRFHYSNLGFGLLGEVVAQARGRSWADVVTGEILRPLGMDRTTTRPSGAAAQGWAVHPWAPALLPEPEHDAGVMAPAGQLWSTARDLARLGAFLLGDTGGVLHPDTVEEMVTPLSGDDGQAGWSGYGLGVQVQRTDGATLAGHGGSMPGFLAGLWVDRAEGAGALTLANTTSGFDNGTAAGLLADLRRLEPGLGEPWRPSVPPVPLDVLGPWFWGPAPYALTARDDRTLSLDGLGRVGRGSRFRLVDGAWTGLDGYFAGETLTIAADHLELATFVLTRTPYDPDAPVPGGVDPRGWQPA